MSIDHGWISIHRKIIDSVIYTDSQAVHLWVHLLLKAAHKDTQFIHDGKLNTIKRGQIKTGRIALSSETGINESKIQRLLKLFEELKMIEQQMNSKSRYISIVNYDSYQNNEQQVNSKRTAGEQQVNTYNNDNNNIDTNVSSESTIEIIKTEREKIPYQEIVEAYHEICLSLPTVAKLNDKRKARLRAAWLDDKRHQSVEFWRKIFSVVEKNDFLTGRTQFPERTWKADFEWIINKNNLIKIIEGKYNNG